MSRSVVNAALAAYVVSPARVCPPGEGAGATTLVPEHVVSRILALTAVLACTAAPLAAQHAFSRPSASYDAAVPTPRAVLGWEIGDRFTPHHMIMRYVERVAAASDRIRVDTVAHTFEGRELLAIYVSSPANLARLDAIADDAARVAGVRGAAEAAAAADRLPAIAWLGFTVHGDEASGVEAALALVYQIAAGQDAETRLILDSTLVIIDPVQNPDGHERHVQDVMRRRGATVLPTGGEAMVHNNTWPGARTSHYQFDLNRDWFVLSHPETRGRNATFRRFWPHVAVDVHEMGSNSTYFFAPPMEPVNKNVHESIVRWWDIYAAANAEAFDENGWSFFRREGYDEFYPGYGVSWPILTGAVGMTYEQASSEGGAIRRSDGTVLTLREAAAHHYAASWATILTTAQRARERVRDYAQFRRSAVTDAQRASMRGVVIARDGQGRADTLAVRLRENGIAVATLPPAASLANAASYDGGRPGPARLELGGYWVDFAQPQGRLAKALLEPDAQLDSSFIAEELERRRTGRSDRFYDVTAWSMPMTYRVRAWHVAAPPAGASEATADPAATPAGAVPAPARARYAYAFEAGSESSVRLLASLLADSVRVWYAPYAFRAGDHDFPRGGFVVRVAANDSAVHQTVARHAAAAKATVASISSSAVDGGTDLGSNSVFFVRPPRVALIGGDPVSGNAHGFAWFALDQRIGYPVTTMNASLLGTEAIDRYDVIVLPSASAPGLDRVLGDGGRARLTSWVRSGGTLVTLEGATAWLATERSGLSRFRQRADSVRADSVAGAPLPAGVPGAIVRATADTLSPLMAGVHQTELPVLAFSDRIYTVPRDLAPGEVVIRHAAQPRLRLSGYLWPEVPARLAESPYLWTESVGQGRVIAFAGDPNFRDMWRGLLPLFANAVLLGPSM